MGNGFHRTAIIPDTVPVNNLLLSELEERGASNLNLGLPAHQQNQQNIPFLRPHKLISLDEIVALKLIRVVCIRASNDANSRVS